MYIYISFLCVSFFLSLAGLFVGKSRIGDESSSDSEQQLFVKSELNLRDYFNYKLVSVSSRSRVLLLRTLRSIEHT